MRRICVGKIWQRTVDRFTFLLELFLSIFASSLCCLINHFRDVCFKIGFLEAVGLTYGEIVQLFRKFNLEGETTLNEVEFEAFLTEAQRVLKHAERPVYEADETSQQLWDALDEDRIGELSVVEVKTAMKQKMSTLGLKRGRVLGKAIKVMALYGFDDDTLITFKDFLSFLAL